MSNNFFISGTMSGVLCITATGILEEQEENAKSSTNFLVGATTLYLRVVLVVCSILFWEVGESSRSLLFSTSLN